MDAFQHLKGWNTMSNQTDFEEMKQDIEAVPDEEVKTPAMPMGIYLQEAEDLYAWSLMDQVLLVAAGLVWALVEGLPKLIGATRFAQSLWHALRFDKEEARAKYQRLSPAAYDLRDQVVHHMLFAFRGQEDKLTRIRAIAEGSGDSDMIQDLSDLAVFGRTNPGPLEAINFDMALLDRCATESDAMSSLLAVARGETAGAKEIKVHRDKAYTLLKQRVDEIREHGRYVFWRNEERLKGYASEYMRRGRRAAANRSAGEAAAPLD